MKQLSTDLKDRVLRYDGVSLISPDEVARYLLLGAAPSQLRIAGVSELPDDLQLFNDNASEQLLLDADEPVSLSFAWQLPEEYKNLDLEKYVIDKTVAFLEKQRCGAKNGYTLDQESEVDDRIIVELREIKNRGMVEFFQIVIYILDVLRAKGVVWGVGRGSSCASYILFILGLHAVDCIRFKVPHTEFFHE